jgi:hypothetical protein
MMNPKTRLKKMATKKKSFFDLMPRTSGKARKTTNRAAEGWLWLWHPEVTTPSVSTDSTFNNSTLEPGAILSPSASPVPAFSSSLDVPTYGSLFHQKSIAK